MKRPFQILFTFFSLSLLLSCAQKRIPSGGPVDQTPPRILSIRPDSINLNVSTISPVFIIFDEMVDQASIYKALRVMPSHFQFEVEWLDFNEVKLSPLKSDSQLTTTVLLSIGTELTDLRKNPISHSLDIIFTPSDSVPTGTISGRIFGSRSAKNLQIWAFNKSDTLYQQPIRFTTPMKDGSYELKYLPQSQKFIPLLIADEGRKFSIDENDKVFLPFYNRRSHHYNFWQSLAIKKVMLPELSKFIFAKKNHLSWRMDASIPAENFHFSGEGMQLMPQFLYVDPQRENIYHAWFDSLKYSEIELNWFVDSVNSSSAYTLELTDELDNIKLDLLEGEISKPISPWDTIRIFSKNPLDSSAFERIKIISKRPANKKYVSPVEYIFFPEKKWATGDQISIEFNFAAIDTSITFKYSLLSNRDLGKISGTIQNKNKSADVHIIATDVNRNFRYEIISNTSEFEFNNIREGYYALNAWLDANDNKKYDAGRLKPLLFPEPFWFSSDTLKVRKRWENHSSVIIF